MKLTVGSACSVNAERWSEHCIGGVCAKLASGSTCSKAVECLSNNCTNNKCQ